MGLSPYELYRDFSGPDKADFVAKVRSLDEIGIDDLAILFDDTRGDVPDLAAREAEIVHTALAHTRASRVLMCPTYYSDDRMLDVVFGERPAGYLDDLGRRLDPRVGVYWTGEEICAREFSPGHLARVAESLGRKPTLWDNYPVNDGPRMSRFLHLRGFTGRPSAIGPHVAAHAINPALQPHLSLIPAATLVASYREGSAYCYMRAFREAARALAGAELAADARGGPACPAGPRLRPAGRRPRAPAPALRGRGPSDGRRGRALAGRRRHRGRLGRGGLKIAHRVPFTPPDAHSTQPTGDLRDPTPTWP